MKRGYTPYLYMNLETGEILTWAEMIAQAKIEYGYDDDTNVCNLSDYYCIKGRVDE